MGPERSGGNHSLVMRGADGGLVLSPISLSNVAPNKGIVIQANSHSPGSDICPGNEYSGVYAAGAVGLLAQASNCGGCQRRHHDYAEVVLDDCGAVGDGGKPCAGQNSMWTAVPSTAPGGGTVFTSALSTARACYSLNVPADLSLHGEQVTAHGDATCDTSPSLSNHSLNMACCAGC